MYVGGIALTTLVASAATTPFSIYHFSRFPTYGIVTNLIAVPLTGIWIMPWGMLGIVLIPTGLDGPCFALMGHGIELIIAAAAFVADLPGAALAVPRPPLAALVATTLGGLWLCLWRTSWRRLGLIGIALGLVLMPLGQPPDLLIDARGAIAAVRLADGRLALSPWQRDRWITDNWLQSAGQDHPADWPAAGQGGCRRLRLRCPGLRPDPRRADRGARPPARGDRGGLPRRRPGRQLSAHRILPGRDAADRPAGVAPRRRPGALARAVRRSTCSACATPAANVPGSG